MGDIAVAGDAAATNIVAKRIESLVVKNKTTLRSPEEVSEKARAILANVKELRTLAKGNKFAFEAGLKFLDVLGGKALPPGLLKSIFDCLNDISIKPLKGVKPGCGPERLHEAVNTFVKGAQKILTKSGATAALTSAPDTVPFKTFIGQLVMSKCGQKDLQSLHDTLNGEDGRKMILFYRDFELGRIDYEDTDPKTTERMRLHAGQYGQRIYQFDSVIAEALGMDIEGYEGVEAKGRIQHDNGYALAISEDFLKTVQNEAKDFGL